MERFGSSLGSGWGSVIKHRVVGVIQFAYPIKKKRRGLYVIFYFSAEGPVIREFKKRMAYEDEVLRALVLRVDEVPAQVPTITGVEIQQQNVA